MGSPRSYADSDLRSAVASSVSWREVLRRLGLTATSAAAIRSVRSRAAALDLDTSHFRGGRRWSDKDLANATAGSRTWAEVASELGLTGGSAISTVKGHAARLGLALDRLAPDAAEPSCATRVEPDASHLRRAAPMLAAAWFTLCGHDVAWPLEPCAYDLLVWSEGRAQRVQVKSTTRRTESGWFASISRHGSSGGPYDPEDIDLFFVVDGDLNYYLIPVSVVGGLRAIALRSYERFLVANGSVPGMNSD